MKKAFLSLAIVTLALGTKAETGAENHAAKLSEPYLWDDQGDGTYINPVLNADYSDPDVIRVGRKYYMKTAEPPSIQVPHQEIKPTGGQYRMDQKEGSGAKAADIACPGPAGIGSPADGPGYLAGRAHQMA